MKKNKYEIEKYIIDDSGVVVYKKYNSKRQAKKDGIKTAYNVAEMRIKKL